MYTVKAPVSGHPRDKKKCPLKRGVCLWEVKNVVFVHVAGNMTTVSVRLREMSAYGRCPLAEVRLYIKKFAVLHFVSSSVKNKTE